MEDMKERDETVARKRWGGALQSGGASVPIERWLHRGRRALTCQVANRLQGLGRSSCGCKAGLRSSAIKHQCRRPVMNHSLSGSKSLENSEEKRLTFPSLPEWMKSCTAYAMGWNRVHTALSRRESQFCTLAYGKRSVE
jgi:hypothetical protein